MTDYLIAGAAVLMFVLAGFGAYVVIVCIVGATLDRKRELERAAHRREVDAETDAWVKAYNEQLVAKAVVQHLTPYRRKQELAKVLHMVKPHDGDAA